MILNSPYISGSLTVTGNEVVTGSLTVLGGITGAITGSATSASFATNASLLNGTGSGGFTSVNSFNSYTSSNDATVTSVAMSTALALASIATLTSRTGSYTTTSSFNSYTSSNDANVNCVSSTATSALVGVGALASKTGSYSTTGSNTFDGGAYFSSSFNPTGFSTTASLYTDGGLRVTRDAYISGTLYLNNVTVFGTQSVAYISSSQLNIGTNLITVNTDTPSIRFGGLAVYDSGSTGLTGSLLWDSQNNHWVYSNPSGSSYSGGMFISGPRTSTLGSETGTTSCALMMGQGGDHITSSAIFHYGNATCIPNILIGSTVCSIMINASCFGVGTITPLTILEVSANNNALGCNNTLRFTDTDTATEANQQIGKIEFYSSDTSTPGAGVKAYMGAFASDTTPDAYLSFATQDGSATPNPVERLRISSEGIACFAGTVCVPNFYMNGGIINQQSGDLSFWVTNVGQAVTITQNTGRLGIGCTTPGQALTVQSSGVSSYLKSTATVDSTTYGNLQIYRQSCKVGNGIGIALGLINSAAVDTEYAYIGTLIESCTSAQECGAIGFYTTTGGTGRCERLRVTSDGSVGIGSTNPLSTLPTGGGTIVTNGWGFSAAICTSRKVVEVDANDNNGGNVGLFLRQPNNSTGLDIWSDSYYGNTYIDSRFDNSASYLTFRFRTNCSNNLVNTMAVTAAGNVSIGSCTPCSNFLLDIYQSQTNTTAYSRIRNNRARNAALQLETNCGNYLVGVGIGADINQFQIYDNTAGSSRLVISSTGQFIVGALNSSLTRNASIVGTSGFSVQHDNNSGTYFDIIPNAAGSTVDLKAGALTGACPPMVFYTSNVERMRITNCGNVLIGMTSSVSGRVTCIGLQVQNEVYSRGNSSGFFWEDRSTSANWGGWYTTAGLTYLYNGSGNASSINMSTGAYTALSDVNKKKDFEDSTIGLNEILQLKPTLYRFKDAEADSQKELGFIAQEVKDYIPQAYVESDGGMGGKFIGLNDRPIIATLVKGMQEQQTTICAQASMINILKSCLGIV
jgi:hypothetical protein